MREKEDEDITFSLPSDKNNDDLYSGLFSSDEEVYILLLLSKFQTVACVYHFLHISMHFSYMSSTLTE